jgi:hypothetical protein
MFIHGANTIINSNSISHIDCESYFKDGSIGLVYSKKDEVLMVSGAEATDIIMRLCPSFLEGKPVKYVKRAWMIHNLVGHPLMQVLSFLGMKELAFKVHDVTIPIPLKRRSI